MLKENLFIANIALFVLFVACVCGLIVTGMAFAVPYVGNFIIRVSKFVRQRIGDQSSCIRNSSVR